MNNFDDLKLAVEALSGGNNTVRLDDLGMPSVLVPFPQLKYADVLTGGSQDPLPAFVVDGQAKDVIYVSKYQNVIVNDRAYSLPVKDPAASISGGFDRCVTVSRNKGAGWHLLTNALWAAIALWCKKNGTMPRGNNNYGQDHANPHEKGVPSMARNSGNRVQRTATGSGPLSWYHNYSESGIADLNGNVWEWVGGMRLDEGEIQIINNGNAMKHDCNMSAASSEWRAIMPDGTLVSPGTAGTVKYTQTSVAFASVTTTPAATGGAALLRALALLPESGATSADYGSDTFWATLTGERLPWRGGSWYNTSSTGVFALDLDLTRGNAHASRGFRAAFYE